MLQPGTKIKQFVLLLLMGCLLVSCIKSYDPDIDKYDELPVIDGSITDAPGPYIVKISKSTRLQQLSKFIPFTRCTVRIRDDQGNSVSLMELSPGVYVTDSTSIRGIPGRKYQLSVVTPDGELYQSAEEVLMKGLGIQSVYGELQHKTDPDLFLGRDGYQFYLDAEPSLRSDNFILWRLQSTYKFNADLSIISYYDKGAMHPVYYGDSLKECYKTVDILDLYLMSTKGQQKTEIKKVLLNYEDNYTKALSIRYSLNVSQFTLHEEAYTYWSEIKKMQDQGGEVYTQQPYQVKNNLTNVTSPDKPVLGYFMVAGLSEKRIFVNAPPIIFRYDVCTVGTETQFNLAERFKNRPELWPVFFADRFGGPYYTQPYCVDCRVGGTKDKPRFWVD